MVKPHRLYFAATIVSYAFMNTVERPTTKQIGMHKNKNCMGQILY